MKVLTDTFLLHKVKIHQCNLLTMCSLFTVTGNNNITHSKNRIGNRNFHSKLQINVFQINSCNILVSWVMSGLYIYYYRRGSKRMSLGIVKHTNCLV